MITLALVRKVYLKGLALIHINGLEIDTLKDVEITCSIDLNSVNPILLIDDIKEVDRYRPSPL